MKNNIVSRDTWRQERIAFMQKEKEFTRLRDELSAQRRALPWVQVEKDYEFTTSTGTKTLAELFDGKSQLIVYHFMYGPDWGAQGCNSCSFWADNFNGIIAHLQQRDVTMVCVSRAPIEKLEAFKQRMGWTFQWASSLHSDFNFDYHVTSKAGEASEYNYREIHADKENERHGISVFYRDSDGIVYHTYSCYAREVESFNTAYRYLDIVPKGRDEDSLPYTMAWVKHRDTY